MAQDFMWYLMQLSNNLAQLSGAVEFTNCFTSEAKTPHPNECPGYGTKQTDGEFPVMLELWGMWSTHSFPLLPGSLRPRLVVPDRVLSMDQIELNCVLMLNWIIWNRTVYMYKGGFGITGVRQYFSDTLKRVLQGGH